MTRDEYKDLRKSPKTIEADIEYARYDEESKLWVFEGVEVENQLGHTIVLNGRFDHRTGEITFNVVLKSKVAKEGGPICRLDVNGTIHPGAGRTHKHDLLDPTCARRNLPHATERPDLASKTLFEVWDDFCKRAKIDHRGKFIPPPEPDEDA